MKSPTILVVEAVLVLVLGSAADGVRENAPADAAGAAESRQTIPIDPLVERLVADLAAERYEEATGVAEQAACADVLPVGRGVRARRAACFGSQGHHDRDAPGTG